MHQGAGVIRAAPAGHAEPEDDLTLLPGGQLEAHLDRGAGIQRRSDLAGQSRPRSARPDCASVPLRPMNSVRSPLTVRVASSTSKKATRSANSVL